jgi:hypothetical protein
MEDGTPQTRLGGRIGPKHEIFVRNYSRWRAANAVREPRPTKKRLRLYRQLALFAQALDP